MPHIHWLIAAQRQLQTAEITTAWPEFCGAALGMETLTSVHIFTHKDKQDCHVHGVPVVEIYGIRLPVRRLVHRNPGGQVLAYRCCRLSLRTSRSAPSGLSPQQRGQFDGGHRYGETRQSARRLQSGHRAPRWSRARIGSARRCIGRN